MGSGLSITHFYELRQEVLCLTASGLTKTQIARQLNIGKASVYRILAVSQKQ
ncbi:helix-turn-helix domain-containing protein [Methylomonas sp. AM2-LC]|uniref:helix-turn-helix domain-containing protein n=1 Tax=Methylomonas sp. AM2-LC TaxID=3153301 RepID=UPI003266EADA